MLINTEDRIKVYTRYPLSSIFNYNCTTTVHYLFGGIGIIVGYNFSLAAYIFGTLYLAFALMQMYLLMPLIVCPNCVYYRMNNSLCVSGMNVVSRKISKEGNLQDFPKRGKGLFCHNNLYMAALIIPIIAMIPAVIINFSFILLYLLVFIKASSQTKNS